MSCVRRECYRLSRWRIPQEDLPAEARGRITLHSENGRHPDVSREDRSGRVPAQEGYPMAGCSRDVKYLAGKPGYFLRR
ncbi:hypothetical protein BN2476_300111 [Paraburkholderia piptadeniae]|uniref:Uncharacterized protein n=1 Tax=Paraburkholderia piptadeniae TaxID=1701573 RepID=A0A1N7S2T9_9BURK|nr:hypothetical protein BN2476_300111 [Paraburkholderia piptadeniae]